MRTGELLRAGPVPVTELRAGIVVGPGSAAFEVIRGLVYHLRVMVTPRWVRSRSQPIAVDDLIACLVRLPDHEETAGEIYDAVGLETLTYEELMRQFARGAAAALHPLGPGAQPEAVLVLARPHHGRAGERRAAAHRRPRPRPGLDGAVAAARGDPDPAAHLRAGRPCRLAEEEAVGPPARWTEGAFRLRQRRHDISFYDKRARSEARTAASPEAVWAEVSAIGGDRDWYYADRL